MGRLANYNLYMNMTVGTISEISLILKYITHHECELTGDALCWNNWDNWVYGVSCLTTMKNFQPPALLFSYLLLSLFTAVDAAALCNSATGKIFESEILIK